MERELTRLRRQRVQSQENIRTLAKRLDQGVSSVLETCLLCYVGKGHIFTHILTHAHMFLAPSHPSELIHVHVLSNTEVSQSFIFALSLSFPELCMQEYQWSTFAADPRRNAIASPCLEGGSSRKLCIDDLMVGRAMGIISAMTPCCL